MKKEEWIEHISSAASQIRKAEPNPYLFSKITQRLNQKNETSHLPVNTSLVLRWALVSCVVLALNIFVITVAAGHKKHTKEQFSIETLSSEMGLNSTYNY